MIPGNEEAPLPPIPGGKGPVAEQVLRRVFPPAEKGQSDEAAIGDGGPLGRRDVEKAAEFLPIIEPGGSGDENPESRSSQGILS